MFTAACYCPGRIYIARGPPAVWRFRNIFLPNIGEDKKNSYLLRAEPLGTVAYGKFALVIALRLKKG